MRSAPLTARAMGGRDARIQRLRRSAPDGPRCEPIYQPGRADMPESENYKKGSEMRRRLLGDAYTDRANKNNYGDPMMRKFIDVATESIFGTLWTRPGLDLKTRTLITVV